MNRLVRSTISLLAAVMMLISLPVMAATTEQDAAAAYLAQEGIYQGDQHGNLQLDKGLTRAELAAVLTRVRGDGQKVLDNPGDYASHCGFSDVADWAKPYVGYCAANSLMQGYNTDTFGSNDAVTPGQACTVILRHLGYPETDWGYTTAIAKAGEVDIAPEDGLEGGAITRGTMAILIYRAMNTQLGQNAGNQVKGQTVADGSGSVSDTKLAYKLIDGKELAREDFSQKANPAIFNGSYTRGMYNALYQSYIDRDIIWPGNIGPTASENFNPYYSYANAVADSYSVRQPFEAILADLTALYGYSVNAEPYVKDLWQYPGYFIVTVMKTDYPMGKLTQDILSNADAQNSRDNIQSFNDHVRARLIYDAKSGAGIVDVFSDGPPLKGACGTYAKCFKYLCDLSNIPAFIISGDNHSWVMVYIEGQWYHCDPTNNRVLVENVKYNPYNPQDVEFAKEILAPGSTK